MHLQNMSRSPSYEASSTDTTALLAGLGLTRLWSLEDDLAAITARGHVATGDVTKTSGSPLRIYGQSNTAYLTCADPGVDRFTLLFELAGVASTYQPMIQFANTSYSSHLYLGSSATTNLQYGNAAGIMTGSPVAYVLAQMIAAEFDLRTSNTAVNVWQLGQTSYGGGSTVKFAGGLASRRLIFAGAFPGMGDGELLLNAAYLQW